MKYQFDMGSENIGIFSPHSIFTYPLHLFSYPRHLFRSPETFLIKNIFQLKKGKSAGEDSTRAAENYTGIYSGCRLNPALLFYFLLCWVLGLIVCHCGFNMEMRAHKFLHFKREFLKL